ncbi:MAG TPA: DUF1127 domain-containing protein [Rhizobiaceae bacterium]|nr:DUF1127 domain-containing protein [Rhizobiaceae bacterium]
MSTITLTLPRGAQASASPAFNRVLRAPMLALTAIRAWRARRREQREARDAFANLISLDDAILDDIGISRADVIWGLRQPLDIDVARVLKRQRGLR